MKHTTKKLTSIFLALSLLVGMMTLFATSASAESDPDGSAVSVKVTSNVPTLFPESVINLDAGATMVKVTYFINTPGYKILNGEWTLEYDGNILTPDLETDGLNVNFDDNGDVVSYNFMRFSSNLSNQVINTDPVSYQNDPNGIKAIKGNITSHSGYNTTESEKREFITVFFKINSGASGQAEVNLNLRTLQARPATAASETSSVVYLVKQNALNEDQATVFFECYPSEAEPFELPELDYWLSIVLKDAIKVKLTVESIPQNTDLNDYTVTSTYKGAVSSHTFTNYSSNELTLANCYAMDMTEVAHLTVRYKGAVIKEGDYSILYYCSLMIGYNGSGVSENLKNLCRSVLNYGSEAQLFFQKQGALPNADASLGCAAVKATGNVPDNYPISVTKDADFTADAETEISLVLKYQTEINFTVTAGANQSINDYSVSVVDSQGNPVSDFVTERFYDENNVIHLRAKVYGIGALHLADYYTATITDPNGKTKTISMCALTYAQMAQTALMKELYQYYTYAQILR